MALAVELLSAESIRENPPYYYGNAYDAQDPSQHRSLLAALEQNEKEIFARFKKGELQIPPWKYLIHPERKLAGTNATGLFPAPVIGERILNWEYSAGYMRVEVYAQGHMPGVGRLIDNGWSGAETVWERDVYLHHPEVGVKLKNDVLLSNYPESIRMLLVPFFEATIKKDNAMKDELRKLAQISGFDLAVIGGHPRVCVPNIQFLHYAMHL